MTKIKGEATYKETKENNDYYEVHKGSCSIGCIDEDNPDDKGEIIIKRLECVEDVNKTMNCQHISQETVPCEGLKKCEAQYTEWSDWTSCSKTCTFNAEDISMQSRIRTCTSNNKLHCQKGSVETKACSVDTCSVSGK